MSPNKVAVKYVNVVDRVIEENRTLVPVSFGITRVDKQDPDPIYARTKRPINTSSAWEDFNDLALKDFVQSGLLGE